MIDIKKIRPCKNGYVDGEYKTTAPFSSFANIVALEPEYLVGDVNGKGEIEIGDITTILTIMAGGGQIW